VESYPYQVKEGQRYIVKIKQINKQINQSLTSTLAAFCSAANQKEKGIDRLI